MSSSKKYIFYGLILNGFAFLLSQLNISYIVLPDFIKGFLDGFFKSLGLVLILFGLYCESTNLK